MRDGIREVGLNYDQASCEIMDDDHPPPRCGNFFASIHGGKLDSGADNQLDERYSFSVTLTMRVTVSLDRVGDQQIARNIARVPLGERQGFNAKADRLRRFLHMNWTITVLTGQTPNSANDNLAAWATGTVYGFVEPMRFTGMEVPVLVGGEWFGAEPDATDVGIKARLSFARCRRFQPVTAASGPFV
mgnify:CR=1 FL=1